MKRYGVLAGLVCVGLAGQQLTREYIRLGGRVIAIESNPAVGFSLNKTTSEVECGDATEQEIGVVAGSGLNWTATENSPYLTLTASSGTGSGSFRFTWANNCGTSTTQRSATITVTPLGGAAVTFTAVQKGGPNTDFSATPPGTVSHCGAAGQISTTAAAGTLVATVAGSNASWITNVAVSGASVSFTAAKNTTAVQRTGKIDLTNGSYRHLVDVTQEARPLLTVTAATTAFGIAEGTLTLVKSQPDAVITNLPSWITGDASGTSLTVANINGGPSRTHTLRFEAPSGCANDPLVAELVITQTNPGFTPGTQISFTTVTPPYNPISQFWPAPLNGGEFSFLIAGMTVNTHWVISDVRQYSGMITVIPMSGTYTGSDASRMVTVRVTSNAVQAQGQATDFRNAIFSVVNTTTPGTNVGRISHLDFEIAQTGQQTLQIDPSFSPKEHSQIVQGGCIGTACNTYTSAISAVGKNDAGQVVTTSPNVTWYPDFYLGPYFVTMDSATSIGDNSPHPTGTGYKLTKSTGAPNTFTPGTVFVNSSPKPRLGRLAVFFVGQAGVGGGSLDFLTYVQKGTSDQPATLDPYFPDDLVTPAATGNVRGIFKVTATDLEKVVESGVTRIDIGKVELKFTTGGSAPMCRVWVQRSGSTWQYFVADTENGAGTQVTTTAAGNTQCILKPSAAPAVTDDTTVAVPFDLEFTPAFRGQRSVTMTAKEAGNGLNEASQTFALNIEGAAPLVSGMTPASGSGAQQVFTFQFNEPFGASNIAQAEVLFGEVGGVNCRARYQHATGTLALYDNDLPGAAQAVGAGMSLSNAVCSISAAAATPTAEGLNLSVNVTFKSPFGGANRLVWARLQNNQDLWSVGDTGWTDTGVWSLAPPSGGGGTTPPPATGGNSVVLASGKRLTANLLSDNRLSLSEWRMEMRFHDYTFTDSDRLLTANGQTGAAFLSASGTQRLRLTAAGNQYCDFDVGGKPDLVLRIQRRLGKSEYGLWQVSNGILTNVPALSCYEPVATAVSTPDNFAVNPFVIGGASWGGVNTFDGAIGHFRMYPTAVTPTTAPSLAAESGALLQYEFEAPNPLAAAASDKGPTLTVDPAGQTVGSMATPGGGGGGTTPPPATGQSVSLNGSQRLLANVAGLGSRNEWRLEMRIHNLNLLDSRRIFAANGQAEGRVIWTTTDPEEAERMLLLEIGAAECRFTVTGKTDLVIRWQKRAGQAPEFGIWAPDSNGTLLSKIEPNHCPAGSAPEPTNFGTTLSIGNASWGGAWGMSGAIAYLRLYANGVAPATTPNLDIEPGATTLLRYEFEGANYLNEISGNTGLTLTVENGPVTTMASPGGTVGGGGTSGIGPSLKPENIGGTPGNTVQNNGVYTMTTSGSYAFFASDSIQFAQRTLNGDGEMEARISSMSGGRATAKAGIMIRDTAGGYLAPGAREVFVALQAGYCLAQWRGATGGETQYVGPKVPAQGALRVKLVRQGNGFSMYCKPEGAAQWTALLPGPLNVTMSPTVLIGLAGAAENAAGDPSPSQLTALFDNVQVNAAAAPGPQLTPVEIGTTDGGYTQADNGFYTMYTKSSYAIDTSDSMHYAYQTVSGSHWDIEALVTAKAGGAATAKAGVMVREMSGSNLPAGGKHVFVALQGSKCLMQWRPVANQGTSYNGQDNNTLGSVPIWLKLEKRGDAFFGYCKPGAATPTTDWIPFYQNDVAVAFGSGQFAIGLGVAAENAVAGGAQLAASFTNVKITQVTASTLTLNPTQSLLLAATGATATFDVQTSGAWTAESRAQGCPGCWLSLGTPSSGTGNGAVTYTAGNNSNWYAGRSGPVMVTSDGLTAYHRVMQKPAGPYTTTIVQDPEDITVGSQQIQFDLLDVPHTLTEIHLDIGPVRGPGEAQGPSATRCYITFNPSLPGTFYMKWAGWATRDQGQLGENRTIYATDPSDPQKVNCGLALGDATFAEVLGRANKLPATKDYRLVVTLTMGANLPAGVKPVLVIARLTDGTNTTERHWETGYWR